MNKSPRITLISAGIISATLLTIIMVITISAKRSTFTQISDIPNAPVAIVFGARVYADHSLSPILKDRVQAGIDLYNAGVVKRLLFTGDNSQARYDEPTSMKKFAMTAGIPESDIILDFAGFSTYDSCYRAKAIFGVDQAILVTQEFHQPRALYTCRSLGIDAAGLAIPDFEKYPTLQIHLTLREWLAHIKAFWMVAITKPEPEVLGEPVPFSDL